MSFECGECQHDWRTGHDEGCPTTPAPLALLTVAEAKQISEEERGPCVCLGTCCGMDAGIPCPTFDRLCATARVGARAVEVCSKIVVEVESDERFHYPKANTDVNAALALIQVQLETRRNTAREILRRLAAASEKETP